MSISESINDDPPPDVKRRHFLAAACGAGALGTLAVLSTQAAAAPAPLAAPAAQPNGYHETDHIRNYYRTARYW